MNTTISSNGLPAAPLATGKTDSNASPASTATGAGGSAAQADDSVKLTDSAHALHQASRATHGPADLARVEQVRKSLAAGTYKVDAHAIAGKLVSLESQISGKS